MLPSKIKSGLSETTNNNKSTPATPRVSKFGRTPSKSESDSRSHLQSSPLSIDRSPKSVDSKPTVERRSSRIFTPPHKQQRAAKESNLQEQLNATQEDLQKTNERLASIEEEKAKIVEELKEGKTRADEAIENLNAALAAQKHAEENSEIEKFRAVELEQAGIEAAQQRDEVWKKEIESVRNQHALDVSALLATTQELQRVKHDLTMATEGKNTALSHAEDAMKIAEINAEKVEILMVEISRLKGLLDAKMDSISNEAAGQIKILNSKLEILKYELERAKEAEKKLPKMEAVMEGLKTEVTEAKRAEFDACALVDDWRKKSELLEVKLKETIQSERSTLESIASAVKELEERNASLQDAESEIVCFKGKVESLEIEAAAHKGDLDEAEQHLEMVKQEKLELEKTMALLKSEFQSMEDEKMKALDNEKQIALNLQTLLEEKNKILNELENSREEVDHSKKAMDGLASALHEVSTEARELKERLLTKQAEVEDAKDQIDDLEYSIKSTEERYESMLDDLRDEIFRLKATFGRSEVEAENSKMEWNAKELIFVDSLKKTEEEYEAIKRELDEIAVKLNNAELEAATTKEEEVQLLNRIKEAEVEAASAKDIAKETWVKSTQLKERLLDKENELQSITQENDDLRTREEAALDKIKELSRLLEEATRKIIGENGILPNNKGSISPSKTIEESCDLAGEKDCKLGTLKDQHEDYAGECEKTEQVNANGSDKMEEHVEANFKTPDSYKVVDKGLSSECQLESEQLDDDLDSKIDTESLFQTNGSLESGASPPSKEEQQKKKKPLLRKFGSLLKKKNNQK